MSRDQQVILLCTILALIAIFFLDRAELYWRRYNAAKALLDDILAKGKVTREHRTQFLELK